MTGSHAYAGVSAVLFDVGNTLHHLDHAYIAQQVTRHSHPVSAAQVAVAEGSAKRAVDAAFRERAGGSDSTRQVKYFDTILAALGVAAEPGARIVAELHAENARTLLWRVLHPDTPRVLSALRQRGFALAVVSNADGRVAAALDAAGIGTHFTTIVDSQVVGVEKPDPRIFQIALDACGVSAAAGIYVGDIYEIDAQGARRAGLTPVLLDPLQHYGDVDCARIGVLADLLDLLPATAAPRSP